MTVAQALGHRPAAAARPRRRGDRIRLAVPRPFLYGSRDLNLGPVLVVLPKPLSPRTVGYFRRTLLPKVATAASHVASYPRVGVRSS
jgi:hypothetical protein